MTQELINEIIDLVNEQRDSQGMITKVDLTLKIKTLLETNFENNSVLDDVIVSAKDCRIPMREFNSDKCLICGKKFNEH